MIRAYVHCRMLDLSKELVIAAKPTFHFELTAVVKFAVSIDLDV